MVCIWRRSFLALDPRQVLPQTAQLPSQSGRQERKALSPGSGSTPGLSSTLATGQGAEKAASLSEVPHSYQALERDQISKQPWQSLWLHSCPVSWPLMGEVPAMLFNMCPSLSRWKENAQSAEQSSWLRSKKLCGARHIISYVSCWWRLQKLVANTGNSLQGDLEAFNNSSLCAYCGSTIFE